MTVKEWFRSVRGIEPRIRSKEEQIRRYRDMAERATGSMTALRVSGGESRSKVESGVVGYIMAETAIGDELWKLVQLRRDVMAVISAMPDQRYRDVMEWHYLTGWTWERIAAEMQREVQWVYVLHGYALNSAREILKSSMLVHVYSLSDVI